MTVASDACHGDSFSPSCRHGATARFQKMRSLLICIALVFASPVLAQGTMVYCPPPEFDSKVPVKGERVIIHKTAESLFATCPRSMNFIYGCYRHSDRTIHINAIGVRGTTAKQQSHDIRHERGHYIADMKGKRWNHEGQRFCE